MVLAGLLGLTASQNLKSDLVDVTQIDRRNYHLFQALLYKVANGSLEPEEIAAPLRGVLSLQCFWKTELFLVPRQMPTLAARPAPSICCAPVGCSLILAGDLVFLHA